MSQLIHKAPISPLKGFLDDSSSQTSSTTIHRLIRRQEDGSPSRRSLSRHSSENSLELMDMSKFYIKMHSLDSQQEMPTIRKTMIEHINQPVRDRKRTPTPTPSRNRRVESTKESSCAEHIESDLIIADLQRKWQEEKEQKELYQKRVAIFQREIKVKLVAIQGLEGKYAESVEREEALVKKLDQYQQIVSLNEASLNEAKSKLEKLKNTIKQNRYAQLETDNTRLKQENKVMKQQIQAKIIQLKAKSEAVSSLQNEVALLKAINDDIAKQSRIQQKNKEIQALKGVIESSKTQKEEQLQKLIHKSNQEKQQMKLKIDKLQLRLNYLNRRKNEEIQALRESKNQIITKLRTKISTVYGQYSAKCEEHQKLKAKHLHVPAQTSRKNALMDQGRAEDRFLFDLSP